MTATVRPWEPLPLFPPPAGLTADDMTLYDRMAEILTRAPEEYARAMATSDPHLNAAGVKAKGVKVLKGHLDTMRIIRQQVEKASAKAAARRLEAEAAMTSKLPRLEAVERVSLAQAFRAAPEEVRLAKLGEVLRGENNRLGAAILASDSLESGVDAAQLGGIREAVFAALPGVEDLRAEIAAAEARLDTLGALQAQANIIGQQLEAVVATD